MKSDPAPAAIAPSQFILRLLDRSKTIDYGAAFALGAWLIALAYIIEDFAERIDRAIDAVDAVIVLIGEKWLMAADGQSRPRIEDPADIVHIEVATALRRRKRVFPVTVGGAKMPPASALPDPLKGLAQLNAVELSDTRWAYDVGRLIEAVKTP